LLNICRYMRSLFSVDDRMRPGGADVHGQLLESSSASLRLPEISTRSPSRMPAAAASLWAPSRGPRSRGAGEGDRCRILPPGRVGVND
jgi:hypothetical protein